MSSETYNYVAIRQQFCNIVQMARMTSAFAENSPEQLFWFQRRPYYYDDWTGKNVRHFKWPE